MPSAQAHVGAFLRLPRARCVRITHNYFVVVCGVSSRACACVGLFVRVRLAPPGDQGLYPGAVFNTEMRQKVRSCVLVHSLPTTHTPCSRYARYR